MITALPGPKPVERAQPGRHQAPVVDGDRTGQNPPGWDRNHSTISSLKNLYLVSPGIL